MVGEDTRLSSDDNPSPKIHDHEEVTYRLSIQERLTKLEAERPHMASKTWVLSLVITFAITAIGMIASTIIQAVVALSD